MAVTNHDDDDASSSVQEPLSWDEARHILRDILQCYLEDHRTSSPSSSLKSLQKKSDDSVVVNSSSNANSESASLLSKMISYDFDLYFGALSLSLILLIVISLSLHSGRHLDSDDIKWLMLKPRVKLSLLYTELIGTIILVLASLLNIVVLQRRRFLNTNDKEHSKRRDLQKFLRTATSNTDQHNGSSSNHNSSNAKQDGSNLSVPCQLTSQTEIYPVFRKPPHTTTTSNTNTNAASWTTIPSLLLVKGDWIALQVGDIAPANCTTIRITTTSTTTTPTTFAAGERITMEALHCTTDSVIANLPAGRTTLQKSHTLTSSEHFLMLCNNMQICILNESPIISSLERNSGT